MSVLLSTGIDNNVRKLKCFFTVNTLNTEQNVLVSTNLIPRAGLIEQKVHTANVLPQSAGYYL